MSTLEDNMKRINELRAAGDISNDRHHDLMIDAIEAADIEIDERSDIKVIDDIKAALALGLTVTLAKSAAYTVIVDSIGQHLIKYSGADGHTSYIGLHGAESTKYADKINMRGQWVITGTLGEIE